MGNGQFVMVFYQNLMMQLMQVRRNIMLIMVPVVVFFFVSFYFSYNEVAGEFLSPIKMAVIDNDDTPYATMLIESFKNNEEFSMFVEIVEGEEQALWESFESGEVDVMIHVPKGFVEKMSEVEELPLEVQINYNDPVKAVLFKNVIISYEKYIRSVQTGILMLRDEMYDLGIDKEIRYAYTDRIFVNLVFTALARQTYFDYHEIVNVPSTTSVKYYFIALMVMFMMYLSVFSAINLIREKQQMCLRRLRITRLSMFRYMLAKAMANSAYMFMIIALWYLIYYLFFGAISNYNVGWLLAFVLVCIFFNVALSLSFTVFFDSEEPVVLLSSIFVFINAVLGGSVVPIHSMSYVISRIAEFTPNYWMIKGILYLDSNYKGDEIFRVALVLMIVAFVLLGMTSFRYSRKES